MRLVSGGANRQTTAGRQSVVCGFLRGRTRRSFQRLIRDFEGEDFLFSLFNSDCGSSHHTVPFFRSPFVEASDLDY